MVDDTPLPDSPELVFALVSPVGVAANEVIACLESSLSNYGYRSTIIKLSLRLKDSPLGAGRDLPDFPEHLRVKAYMDLGNELCKASGRASAIAELAAEEILVLREQYKAARIAWLVDSLKRPAEVIALREVYGDHLIVISLQSSSQSRELRLRETVRAKTVSISDTGLESAVSDLLSRDLSDSDSGEFGQNVLKAFPMGDVFIDCDDDISSQVERFCDLLFGNPEHSIPTPDEHGMQLAYIASTTSPELGLKVGAALMDGYGVVSLGSNAHPMNSDQTPPYDRSKSEIERLLLDTVQRLVSGELMVDDVNRSIEENPDQWIREITDGLLKGSAMTALTEFQPTVHAEMAALLEASKRGGFSGNVTMYITAYPCHSCAKHLLRAEVAAKYLEPYPKSLTQAMYGSAAENFRPFTGIAPRRYSRLFATTQDRKGPDGTLLKWTRTEREKATPNVDPLLDQRGIEDREAYLCRERDLGGAGSGGS